jgi:hypothetical protein
LQTRGKIHRVANCQLLHVKIAADVADDNSARIEEVD